MARMISFTKPKSYEYSSFEIRNKHELDVKFNYGIFTQTIGSVINGKRISIFGRMSFDGKHLFAYTAQKFNKKSEQKQKIVRGKNTTQSKMIRNAHWKIKVFRFPVERVVDFKQQNNTFKITLTS